MPGVNSQLNTFSESVCNGHLESECASTFTVRFWGVRGNIPTSSSCTSRYGGNTACVELSVADKRLIFDGGTGLRLLGEALCDRFPIEAHLFFTHTQLDRIQGFPFFRPAFQPGNRFYIYGPQSSNGASIKHALTDQMVRPRFPVPFHKMRASLKFHTLAPGTMLNLDDVMVETITLNSDSLALGYRVTFNDYSVVYATDSYCSTSPQGLQYLAKQADLLIFDAVQSGQTYYEPHCADQLKRLSTWKQSIDATLDAGVKQVVMFYHDPSHEDTFLSQVEAEMQSLYPNVAMAQEGTILTVG